MKFLANGSLVIVFLKRSRLMKNKEKGGNLMIRKLFVHVKSMDGHQAMYVNGQKEIEDFSMIDIVEALDILIEKMAGNACILEFTHEELLDEFPDKI